MPSVFCRTLRGVSCMIDGPVMISIRAPTACVGRICCGIACLSRSKKSSLGANACLTTCFSCFKPPTNGEPLAQSTARRVGGPVRATSWRVALLAIWLKPLCFLPRKNRGGPNRVLLKICSMRCCSGLRMCWLFWRISLCRFPITWRSVISE